MKHGKESTYNHQGCRCFPCSEAKRRADKRRNIQAARGIPRKVDRAPSIRKIQALCAIGWPLQELAREMGRSKNYLTKTLCEKGDLMLANAQAVDALYRRLEAQPGPSNSARVRARSKGWVPPLGWDDIESGILWVEPKRPSRPFLDRFDEEEIEYVLQYHDFTRPLNKFEKAEIVRRWIADGRSERSLCRLTGWREGRYRDPRPTEEAA